MPVLSPKGVLMVETEDKTYGRLVRIPEAADWLGVSVHTLRSWIQDGRVESHKLFGRRLMYEDELIRLIELSRIPAKSEARPRVESLTTKTRGRADNR